MTTATGPWEFVHDSPIDAKRLYLVKVKNNRNDKVSFYVLRFARGKWQFQDRLLLSGDEEPIAWAVILE